MVNWFAGQLCMSAAFSLTAWRSFKAVKAGVVDFDLLRMWSILSLACFVETYLGCVLAWVPLYYVAKCALLALLLVPCTRLTGVIFAGAVVPAIGEAHRLLNHVVLPRALDLCISLPWRVLVALVPVMDPHLCDVNDCAAGAHRHGDGNCESGGGGGGSGGGSGGGCGGGGGGGSADDMEESEGEALVKAARGLPSPCTRSRHVAIARKQQRQRHSAPPLPLEWGEEWDLCDDDARGPTPAPAARGSGADADAVTSDDEGMPLIPALSRAAAPRSALCLDGAPLDVQCAALSRAAPPDSDAAAEADALPPPPPPRLSGLARQRSADQDARTAAAAAAAEEAEAVAVAVAPERTGASGSRDTDAAPPRHSSGGSGSVGSPHRSSNGQARSIAGILRQIVTGDADIRVRDHLFDLQTPTPPPPPPTALAAAALAQGGGGVRLSRRRSSRRQSTEEASDRPPSIRSWIANTLPPPLPARPRSDSVSSTGSSGSIRLGRSRNGGSGEGGSLLARPPSPSSHRRGSRSSSHAGSSASVLASPGARSRAAARRRGSSSGGEGGGSGGGGSGEGRGGISGGGADACAAPQKYLEARLHARRILSGVQRNGSRSDVHAPAPGEAAAATAAQVHEAAAAAAAVRLQPWAYRLRRDAGAVDEVTDNGYGTSSHRK